MALLGEDIDSIKALNWGLVYEVIPDDELKQKAIEYAIQLANGSITGLKAIVRAHDNAFKSTLFEQLDYERDTQRILTDGDVFKEGVTAFIEKRKPNFRDIE
jgi:2-(1,2-epoxy-1,2-dihydrophenyl)acetyl-CoA isomerase